MTIAAILLVFFLLFACSMGLALRDVFRQTAQGPADPSATPRSRPRDDVPIAPPQPAVSLQWTALDDIQLTRLLLDAATSKQQLPTKSDQQRHSGER